MSAKRSPLRSTAPAPWACAPPSTRAGSMAGRCATAARRPVKPSRPRMEPCFGSRPAPGRPAAWRWSPRCSAPAICNRERPPLRDHRLTSEYGLRARAGRTVRLRQIASVIPSAMHAMPDQQAARLAAKAGADGFDLIRKQKNRLAWDELWKGRIRVTGGQRALARPHRCGRLLSQQLGPRLLARFDLRSLAWRPGTTITTILAM